MRAQSIAATVLLGSLAAAPPAQARQGANIVLRTGQTISGEVLDLGGVGFTLRVPEGMRQIQEDLVAVVDFIGAGVVTADEAARLRTSRHLIVLRSGLIVGGRLFGAGGTPVRITFDTDSGRREYAVSDVARLVLAVTNPDASTTAGPLPPGPVSPPASAPGYPPASSVPPASALPPVGSPPAGTPPPGPPQAGSTGMTGSTQGTAAGGTTYGVTVPIGSGGATVGIGITVPGGVGATGAAGFNEGAGCDLREFAGEWNAGALWGTVTLQAAGVCEVAGSFTGQGGGSISGVVRGKTLRFSWGANRNKTEVGEGDATSVNPDQFEGRWCTGRGCQLSNSSTWRGTRTRPAPAGTPGAQSTGTGLACNVPLFAGNWTGAAWGEIVLTPIGGCQMSGTYTDGNGQLAGTMTGDILPMIWRNSSGEAGVVVFYLEGGAPAGAWCRGTGCSASQGTKFSLVRR